MTNRTGNPGADEAWQLIRRAADLSRMEFDRALTSHFRLDGDQLVPVTLPDSRVSLSWIPEAGWKAATHLGDACRALFDLYLPVASAHPGAPLTVGHLGQSLDGFIATTTGDSYYVTGPENVRHLHRMRALCDAVIVGAGTLAADDPQLTTRRVPGPSPLRVVIDRTRRLDDQYRVFNDGAAPTLLVCGESSRDAWGPTPQVEILRLPTPGGAIDLKALTAALHARGCSRIFVEGGGVTVSSFLQAGLLDRLQIAVAPLIIGDGRPAIRLPAAVQLSDCRRPSQRIFRMGNDILFECLFAAADEAAPIETAGGDEIERIR